MNFSCNLTNTALQNVDYNDAVVREEITNWLKNCTPESVLPLTGDKETELIFRVIFFIVAIIENLLLLILIYRDPLKRFRNAPSYFVANFAGSELVCAIGSLCYSLTKDPRLIDIAACVAAIGLQASFMIIIIFAVDRHIAIAMPYRYERIMKVPVFISLMLFPWCFSILILPLVYLKTTEQEENALTYMIASDIIILVIILLVIHPVTYSIYRKQIKRPLGDSQLTQNVMREKLKMAKILRSTVFLVSISLIFFELPLLITFCFNLASCKKCFENKHFQHVWRYYHLLRSIRSMVTPFIYAWRLPLYRAALKSLFKRQLPRKKM